MSHPFIIERIDRASIAETGLHLSDFSILEALLHKGPLPINTIGFRTDTDATQTDWQSALRSSGVAVTNVRDRKYFRSIYFHAPEGMLFEIAIDPPGFIVDKPVDELGASLKLPADGGLITADNTALVFIDRKRISLPA